ncbi:MAG: branched-chain amino acid ABC transporter permease [Anaerolineaceae bacterium]|jgi:branched-chain amino acid transport system permease protein|nr:branched-chain amino acid ABC transporter permease [Anaerolineae bacterium]MDX9830297.1 branched-chain amino acid ABC transporter permease [Anaerolineae bacterium]NLF11162.1 branched-chain amino acid ABC transporter permease [Anaerolineaceae bacterium]
MKALKYPAFWLTLALVVAAGLAVWITQSATLREEMFLLLMYVALATSLNILLGFTGYVNFGHIVFFGLGGYVGFYFLSQHGWPLWWAALAGGAAAGLLALLLGAAVLRLRGAYFALATIGVNEAVRAFINSFTPFGGPTGMSLNFSTYDAYGGPASALWLTFAAMFGLTLLVLVVSYLVKFSRFGLGLMVIREDEDAAMVMGVHTPWTKTWAFVLSAFFPGIVGALFFFKNGNVEPGDAFRLQMSIETIVMVMLGGQGTVLGPLVGSAAYERLRGYLLTSPLFKNLHLAFAGLLLLIIILFVPAGLIGWLRGRFPRLRRVLE